MTLHIFNPEHDLALANAYGHFTPPSSIRNLRNDLGFIPALWAKDNDMVLVNNIEVAKETIRHIRKEIADITFVDKNSMSAILKERWHEISQDVLIRKDEIKISPWGWDRVIKEELLSIGFLEKDLPDDNLLLLYREISSRKWMSERFSPRLRRSLLEKDFTSIIGTSKIVKSMEAIEEEFIKYPRILIKSPWSCSGRGVRYAQDKLDLSTEGWCKNTLEQQGYLLIEPYYSKLEDFGMEFDALPSGEIKYKGLSIFSTTKNAYNGSLLATEESKEHRMAKYMTQKEFQTLKEALLEVASELLGHIYTGPFGIDMMIVANPQLKSYLVHPCVELNLRRTMGHIAIAISPNKNQAEQIMRIENGEGGHKLKIQTQMDDIINNSIV